MKTYMFSTHFDEEDIQRLMRRMENALPKLHPTHLTDIALQDMSLLLRDIQEHLRIVRRMKEEQDGK